MSMGGRSEEARKIHWDKVCIDRENGGLGVRRVSEFNLSLFGKWWWRMLVEREGLWFKVLAAKYGVEDGLILGGGNKASVWWEDLVRVKEGRGHLVGRWFDDNVSRVMGDGESLSFWMDDWLGGIP
ncbi:putative non-LTR retroelement reverse transcriptase [Trifolium medium]|uniref:Putative non-LTR retroelement reverse transcriptase n=1 Tax=Trifolium medium TaxID=97028 RepID=A0A392MY55_9FABA|nr:putative non-LTR retroelement reverse transcriptase [Trifolium medium]